ncbi:MAG TPA: alpha/beta fold hydrolase [Planctomycetaceae bacterium]|nr:alpha/beta fold hydrolase [Planctomycetaceae bacterium]
MPASPKLLIDGPKDAPWTIALAHGAGAPMDSPFMSIMAQGLAKRGYRVARFEFPYMAARRTGGRRGAPDREPVLRETWLAVVESLGRERLIIGGKSMGGRIASMVADEAAVAGLVCLGYPFHPVGKPTQLRVKHLEELKTPTLILQGERDPFGGRDDVATYKLSRAIRVHWLTDGDHSFKPRKSSGVTEAQNLETAIAEIDKFARSLASS